MCECVAGPAGGARPHATCHRMWCVGAPFCLQQQTTKLHFCRPTTVADGSHNVSRWMTWLPISLKNAAKCDKWYQLQNHLITESLNAKGAREKLLVGHPRACRISQCRSSKKKSTRASPTPGVAVGFSVCARLTARPFSGSNAGLVFQNKDE